MKNSLQLFPYLLTRTAGGTSSDLKKMELRATIRLLHKLHALDQKHAAVREALSEKLYQHVAMTKDARLRHTLIQLRRDVFNDRSVTYPADAALASLPTKIVRLLTTYINLAATIQDMQETGEQLYAQEFATSRAVFRQLIVKPSFSKGLVLASESLPESFQKYQQLEEQDPQKPVTKFERSIMEYLARMYTKPSPFSTFTQIGLAVIDNTVYPPVTSRRRVRLNHVLYGYIFGLLVQHKTLRKRLSLQLNLSVYEDKGQLVFLTGNGNREALQRIEAPPPRAGIVACYICN